MGIKSWIRGGDPTDPNSRAYARVAMRKRSADVLNSIRTERATVENDWTRPEGIQRPELPQDIMDAPSDMAGNIMDSPPTRQPKGIVEPSAPTKPYTEPDQASPFGMRRPNLPPEPPITDEQASEARSNFKVIEGGKKKGKKNG